MEKNQLGKIKMEKQGHPKFYQILEELAELHSRKNAQYASIENPLGNFKRGSKIVEKLLNPAVKNKPLAYALTLASKQIDGVMEIVGEGKENTPDSLKEKLYDIAVYSVIAVIVSEENE